MKRTLQLVLIVFFLSYIPIITQAQNWTQNLPQDKIDRPEELTFFEIQKAFNDYWEPFDVKNGYYTVNGEEKKAPGWKQFKRWEWYWEPRVDPTTGEFPEITAADIRKELKKTDGIRAATGNWTSLGPTSTTGGYAGIGRLNCIAFVSGSTNRFYVGAPAGGLWKTTNGGTTWTVLTDDNDVLGVSDAVVIPTAGEDIIYIATGDRDGGSMWALDGQQSNDNNSIGVLKSIDGGTTWMPTGLSFKASQRRTVNRLLKDPTNNNILYAATSNGVYKTTDAGISWTLTSVNVFIDMEFKPGTPTTLYGSTMGGTIYKSSDSGASWLLKGTITGGSRVEIAVSANQPTWVYALVCSSTDGGFLSVQKSINSGDTYTEVFGTSGNKNLLGWYCTGSDVSGGGQGTYDLCIAADPNDANKVYVGGVNTWYSSNGGTSWTISNMWTSGSPYNTCGTPVVHADKHFFEFQNGTSTLFECNDGGLYKTSNNGTSWTHLTSSGMIISQVYRMGTSQVNSNYVIAGLQDNGTKSMNSGTWSDVMGGDGFDCAIKPSSSATQYGSLYYGRVKRTTSTWSTSADITNNGSIYLNGITSTESGLWCSPFKIDPTTNNTIYIGLTNLWKSTNQGSAWTKISSFTSGQKILAFDVLSSNSNTIYVVESSYFGNYTSKVHKTTNGGTSWTDITGTLPVGSANITDIKIKKGDANTVWVTFGAYNSIAVYQTTNGGTTWTDISTGIPQVPVMSIIQNTQNTTVNELYVATDVGVYVKVGNANWTPFNTNLPNVVVTDLDIYYNTGTPSLSRLRAGTFGRGLWESELFSNPNLPPVTDFFANNLTPNINSTVQLTDQSINLPTSWLWSFEPSTVSFVEGTSASSQNPKVVFTEATIYNVTLYAQNTHGNNTTTKTSYISAIDAPTGYCEAYSTNPAGYIQNFSFGSVANFNTGYTNVGSADPNDKYYQDFTSLIIDVNLLETYTLYVLNGYNGANENFMDLSVWIDFNRDGDFDDTGEQVVCDPDDYGEGTFDVTIPITASLGATRMRVKTKYIGSDCGSPCGSTSNGEVEDYTLNIKRASNIWQGTSTSWATASNWSKALVPTSYFNVTIPTTPTGGNFPVIALGTNATCNNLTIESGANLKINGSLTVLGSMTNNAGTSGLVVKSDVSGTGSLIANTNNVDGTVERYITGGKWHLFGAPVANQTAHAVYFDHDPDVWLKTYIESSDNWSQTITNLNTPLPMGSGFAIWVKSGLNAIASFEDQMNSSDFSITGLTYSGSSYGYNMLANPFASAIDWDQGSWVRNNLDGSVWVYDPAGGSYRTRNSVGVGSLTNGIIPSSQAFFVRTTSSGGSITVPADARVHSSQAFYKNGTNTQEENQPFTLAAINVSIREKTDEAWFIFNEACTKSYDNGWDVSKFFGDVNAPQLYAVEADNLLSVDALPAINEEITVSLNFVAGENGEHLLKLSCFENFVKTKLWLEDEQEGIMQELTENPEYTFYASTDNSFERFLLHFIPESTGIISNSESNYTIYSWKNSVYIKNPELESNADIEIVDMYGRIIYHGKLQAVSLNKIDLNLSNSYLLVRLIDKGNVTIQKVFIR
ncbi:MAG TPA: GEVED domain-containing protein [Bacteroidales bacterium]